LGEVCDLIELKIMGCSIIEIADFTRQVGGRQPVDAKSDRPKIFDCPGTTRSGLWLTHNDYLYFFTIMKHKWKISHR